MTKKQAIAEVKSRGFTVHFDTGMSGDYAYGSRLYYCKPSPAKNQYGVPLESASISRVSRSGWTTHYFVEKTQ